MPPPRFPDERSAQPPRPVPAAGLDSSWSHVTGHGEARWLSVTLGAWGGTPTSQCSPRPQRLSCRRSVRHSHDCGRPRSARKWGAGARPPSRPLCPDPQPRPPGQTPGPRPQVHTPGPDARSRPPVQIPGPHPRSTPPVQTPVQTPLLRSRVRHSGDGRASPAAVRTPQRGAAGPPPRSGRAGGFRRPSQRLLGGAARQLPCPGDTLPRFPEAKSLGCHRGGRRRLGLPAASSRL